MHGGGKSDEAIVAVKPANAAEQSAAELVEPRAEAKGNAARQSTYRTQRRVDVSPAPDRIRHRARGVSFGPEVGAVCGKAARTVLYGGRSAMSVPTATKACAPSARSTAWARREERAFAQPTAESGDGRGERHAWRARQARCREKMRGAIGVDVKVVNAPARL